MWCYGHLRFLFLNHIEGDWRWRWWDLGKPPEADQLHPLESVQSCHKDCPQQRRKSGQAFQYHFVLCGYALVLHVVAFSFSCISILCVLCLLFSVYIFSEDEALNCGQMAGRAATAKFREDNKDRIAQAKARLPDSKFGLIWSSARYVCVESYVHLLVLMTLCGSHICASSDSYCIFHHPCGRQSTQ